MIAVGYRGNLWSIGWCGPPLGTGVRGSWSSRGAPWLVFAPRARSVSRGLVRQASTRLYTILSLPLVFFPPPKAQRLRGATNIFILFPIPQSPLPKKKTHECSANQNIWVTPSSVKRPSAPIKVNERKTKQNKNTKMRNSCLWGLLVLATCISGATSTDGKRCKYFNLPLLLFLYLISWVEMTNGKRGV